MQLLKYKLGELLDVSRGASLSGEFYSSEGELIRLTLGHFDYQNGGFKENTSKDNLYFVGSVKSQFILNEGDIITPLTEQTPGLLGSTAMIPESGKYIQSQDVALIRCKEDMLDPMFCYYLLPSMIVKSQLGAAAQQTKIRHTTPDRIKDVVVFIPELEEQRRIGVTLHSIDRKIALNREINRNLEAMARQLYDYWFVQFDFPDENGKPYKSSGGKMVWNERLRREIPDNWVVENLSDAAEIYNGATPSTAVQSNYGGDIVWITPKDLSEQQCKFVYHGARNISQQGYDSCSTHMLPTHSLLMSSRAPIGLLSISEVPLCTNQGFKSFVPKDGYDVFYIFYYIRQQLPKIEQLGTGTTFKEVSREDLMRFPILKIPQGLQREWLSRVESMAERQFKSVLETDKLKKQRDELLPLLMNGQVSVMPTEVNCDLSHD